MDAFVDPTYPHLYVPAAQKSKEISPIRVASNPGKLHDWYTLQSPAIGKGTFGYVLRAIQRSTDAPVAIKCIAKHRVTAVETGATEEGKTAGERKHGLRHRLIAVKKEIDIMMSLQHPNIVTLFDTFENPDSVFLVMDFCEGGELGSYLVQRRDLTEAHVSMIMAQVFRGVQYMHEQGITHRDLKPANILMATCEPVETNTVKIVDFGIACVVESGMEMRRRIGTLFYMAPQVLLGRYCAAADLWSCGTILYLLLCGYPPFDAKSEVGVVASIQRGNYTFLEEDWYSISEGAKELIRSLLQMDPTQRCTASSALKSEWIAEVAPGSVGMLTMAVSRLAKFQSRWKEAPPARRELDDRADDPSFWDNVLFSWLTCGSACGQCSSSKMQHALVDSYVEAVWAWESTRCHLSMRLKA
eukprot:TRINITY_DN15208_c0_g1_i4.p1 TRINITY_DN15208_c0_g1~~TRINITY_DN15208_c0_g1_i4.p1  ORF type:complete len:414 (-),score=86.48 TRINITY_DN15208_c0_g1_i4:365-1606(-)